MSSLEWKLLLSSLAPAAALQEARASTGDLAALATHLLEEKPEYVLQHPASARFLAASTPSHANTEENNVFWHDFVAAQIVAAEMEDRRKALMIAAAALHIFVQANLTGSTGSLSEDPRHINGTSANGNRSQAAHSLGEDSTSVGDRWALKQLAADGEDVGSKCLLPQYLLLAQTVLLSPLGLRRLGHAAGSAAEALESCGPRLPETWLWWAARLLTLRQRLLSGLSHSLREALSVLLPKVIRAVEEGPAALGAAKGELVALAHLEAALVEHVYSNPGRASQHLDSAQERLGFTAELSGALGLRTVHQADPKAQLVVKFAGGAAGHSEAGDPAADLDAAAADQGGGKPAESPEAESDVLESVKLVEEPGISGREELSPLEQAVLLALGEQQRRATARDELRPWEIVAFANAVLAQPASRFLLRFAARLSRVRFERGRSRTRERALLAMEHLVEAVSQPATSGTRSCFAFAVLLPLRAELRKELGEQMVASGLVGAAMELFEDLELWDSLLLCYRLLEKVPQALSLVRKRLEIVPDDARLLCALGDLTREPQHYKDAWERSGHRNARAQRSLAQFHMAKSDFQQAAEHWELALAINPLHPGGWFSLGFCRLKGGEPQRAVRAFTRCTQQQPDNGEAWNNIAAVMLQEGKYKEAFSALSEAVKYKRDSWQTWSNLAGAAAKVESWQTAARAVHQAGELTQWQRSEPEVLEVLVRAVAEARRREDIFGIADAVPKRAGDQILERSVQSTLKAVANSPGVTPTTWGLIAKLNEALGFPASSRDALRKQVRGLAGVSWQSDRRHFLEYAGAVRASAELSLSLATGGDKAAGRDLASARMLLQSLTKSASEELRSEATFLDLQELLNAVVAAESKLKAGS